MVTRYQILFRARSALVFASLVALSAISARVHAEDGTFTKEVNFEDDTQDVHVKPGKGTVGVTITGSQPYQTNQNKNEVTQYNAAWKTPPGKGKRTLTISFTNNYDDPEIKYILTDTGDINQKNLDWQHAQELSMLETKFDPSKGTFAVSGGNGTPGVTSSFGDITVTAVKNAALFSSADWMDATGTTYTVAGADVSAGQADYVFASGLPLNGASWVLLQANVDGESRDFAYKAVPGPTAVLPMVFGLAARLRRRSARSA